jgi:hypothetical protein
MNHVVYEVVTCHDKVLINGEWEKLEIHEIHEIREIQGNKGCEESMLCGFDLPLITYVIAGPLTTRPCLVQRKPPKIFTLV